ncbi:hypothetical protein H2200_005854 [Cladophialophora chaetospira]|uniref:Uncharacterized protein n=1 Tax=Cladophialophora chaetospira TaxID=386627 RepID=A0AA38X9U6_9EURO|nr:hypothetical protein H2200_005854 [Cladophialophora chaetospira]
MSMQQSAPESAKKDRNRRWNKLKTWLGRVSSTSKSDSSLESPSIHSPWLPQVRRYPIRDPVDPLCNFPLFRLLERLRYIILSIEMEDNERRTALVEEFSGGGKEKKHWVDFDMYTWILQEEKNNRPVPKSWRIFYAASLAGFLVKERRDICAKIDEVGTYPERRSHLRLAKEDQFAWKRMGWREDETRFDIDLHNNLLKTMSSELADALGTCSEDESDENKTGVAPISIVEMLRQDLIEADPDLDFPDLAVPEGLLDRDTDAEQQVQNAP